MRTDKPALPVVPVSAAQLRPPRELSAMDEGGPVRIYGRPFSRSINRFLEWRIDYLSGKSQIEIATKWGVTKQAVNDALKRVFGISYKNSPNRLSFIYLASKRKNSIQKREMACAVLYGCSIDTLLSIKAIDCRAPRAYRQQKQSAKRRGILWSITFREWWDLWQQSGVWEKRGRGSGYCMARWGDSGPYEMGNVYICTIGQNFSDSYLVHPQSERIKKRRQNRTRKGIMP